MRLISGRVILAAARLALFYTAVVILEIGVLQFALLSGFPTLRSIGRMAMELSVPVAGELRPKGAGSPTTRSMIWQRAPEVVQYLTSESAQIVY